MTRGRRDEPPDILVRRLPESVKNGQALDFIFRQRQSPFSFIFFKEEEGSIEQGVGEDILLQEFAKLDTVESMAVMDVFFRLASVLKSVMGKPTGQIGCPPFPD